MEVSLRGAQVNSHNLFDATQWDECSDSIGELTASD
jgi:hypothetical protein